MLVDTDADEMFGVIEDIVNSQSLAIGDALMACAQRFNDALHPVE